MAEIVNFSGDEIIYDYFRLITKKIVYRGEKGRQIVDWKNCMTKDECPEIYLEGYPHFYENIKGTLVLVADSNGFFEDIFEVEKRRKMSEEGFQNLILIIEQAGHRMHEIRQQIKEVEKDWVDKDPFVTIIP